MVQRTNTCWTCGRTGQGPCKCEMEVRPVMNCFSCVHWDATYARCHFGLALHKYLNKDFCRRWQSSPKYSIAQEAVEAQVKLSRWNGPHIPHRRLEPL